MPGIDENFRKVTAALRKHGQDGEQAFLNQALFRNESLAQPVTDTADPLNDAKVKKQFDRTGLEKTYKDTIERPSDANGVNVAIAAKLQSDFLAGCERDARAQYDTSPIRAVMLAAARRRAEGLPDGPVSRGIVQVPVQYLNMGRVPSSSSSPTSD